MEDMIVVTILITTCVAIACLTIAFCVFVSNRTTRLKKLGYPVKKKDVVLKLEGLVDVARSVKEANGDLNDIVNLKLVDYFKGTKKRLSVSDYKYLIDDIDDTVTITITGSVSLSELKEMFKDYS